jgi:hypothetical protein
MPPIAQRKSIWGVSPSSIRQDIQKSAMTVPVVASIPNQYGFETPMAGRKRGDFVTGEDLPCLLA